MLCDRGPVDPPVGLIDAWGPATEVVTAHIEHEQDIQQSAAHGYAPSPGMLTLEARGQRCPVCMLSKEDAQAVKARPGHHPEAP